MNTKKHITIANVEKEFGMLTFGNTLENSHGKSALADVGLSDEGQLHPIFCRDRPDLIKRRGIWNFNHFQVC